MKKVSVDVNDLDRLIEASSRYLSLADNGFRKKKRRWVRHSIIKARRELDKEERWLK